jgi:hypothetical protein
MSYEPVTVFDASDNTKIAADDARDELAFQDFGGEHGHGGIGGTSGKASEFLVALSVDAELGLATMYRSL